ncbi:hypothetical protein DNK47_01220 [Mycoplasma wenyonii]|uniref:Uncharacterized protein n=1 Tax=Mycoplasma wenyonii TaxID=65123 RepID=A0A328PPZ3_9MOLU|nr:hypothetical protein [Mycoplasma wenyonii]RAO95226.1 hypothetical protein DNK47_01220 [Mycoplasma wenyonii]
MIPFKLFAPALISLIGIGWVISGIVQHPRPLTLKDVVAWDESKSCFTSFKTDITGFTPFSSGCSVSAGGALATIVALLHL